MSETGALPKEFVEQQRATPMTNSFVHLHLGIDATGLPADLESHCESPRQFTGYIFNDVDV